MSDTVFDPANPDPDVLDKGTLPLARFDADGRAHSMPLTFGEGPPTQANGFTDPGDVTVHTRRAADFPEATPMDRPEDVEPNPDHGTIYVMLTNNTRRKSGDENPANLRAENAFGHIVVITAPDMDFVADESGPGRTRTCNQAVMSRRL